MEGNLDLTCVSFPPYVPYYPQVIAEASPWSMLTAIGTLSAVVVSVIFGLLGWIRSQKDRSELIGLRQEAAERETREAEAERRRVVGLVTAWITEEYRRDPRIEGYRRTVTLHIANESNGLFRFWSAWGCDCVGVVRPGVGEPWVENGDVKSAISTPKAHHEIYLFFLSCGRRDLSYHRTWPDDRGRIHRRG